MKSFRAEYPRLYGLKDCIADPTSPDAYFQNFDETLLNSTHVREVYSRLERTLQELDASAWAHLKEEIVPYLGNRDSGRGWQQLFDILNEARAYRYLKSIGCTAVRFIPRARKPTPDLEGTRFGDRFFCEVKTINISDDEVAARTSPPTVRSLPMKLAPQFLGKLSATVSVAKQQLLAHDPSREAKHLVYLNIVFDDFLAECKEAYFQQIDGYLASAPDSDVRLIICNDYTAFYKPLQMRHADVDNVG
ncbi:MAG: hypothetical protein ABSF23_01045 [Terracidiphilus sp.]|jgi:hypothetical protein